ncbi:hypothetical protein BC941DRAFT_355571 [Chlamydoabsidia padenii]|nr:hypothetical protein BC941DRAFT_355571 [Chlamydoabsidia padenii]
MSKPFQLDPIIVQNAKQVYIHLGHFDKQRCLSNTALHDLPIEIQKMHLLYCTDPPELTKTTRQFLQSSQRSKRKSTLNDFIKAIEVALDSLSDDWGDDDFDDLDDLDLDEIEKITNNTSKKRTFEEMASTTNLGGLTSPDTPLADSEYFRRQYQDHIQLQNSKVPGYNVIASPTDPLDFVEKAPLVFQMELARFMTACMIPWDRLDAGTAQRFLELARNSPHKIHDEMMKWYSTPLEQHSETKSNQPLNGRLWNMISLERCSDLVWKYGMNLGSSDESQQQKDGDVLVDKMATGKLTQTKSLRYTAKIHFPDNKEEQPFVQLNVPRIQSSNRFYRKFGAERFLELRLSKHIAPESIGEHTPFILRPFLLMGRTYRFLFLKDDRLVLFATEGPGLKSISIHSVINWHIPILQNWDLTTCKFASRMSLGYSNSISTLTFDPENIRLVDDVFAVGRPRDDSSCMTDGCGIISASAMRKIMGSQQNDILPCAIQGRIGGAKGLWIVSPNLDMESGDWIEIRTSQNKFKTGLPDPITKKTDPIHYTFDLVKSAICIYPSHLNTQFIQCLAAGGVPTVVFLELLKEHIGNVSEILTDIRNTQVLRDWVVKAGGIQGQRRAADGLGINQRQATAPTLGGNDDLEDFDSDKTGPTEDVTSPAAKKTTSNISRINSYSGFPSNLYESIVRLLDAGFDLTNAYIANRTTSAFKGMLQSLSTKYRVEVQQSCTVMCIPDPTGTLKPNEVFLQLSSRRIDEKTGIHAGLIVGDILVSRNPCGLKSDIQKVQAVDCSPLRVYSDVIVCPIQGFRSLASKLSGGDYDGDLIFCCWDRRVVEPFNSSPVPETVARIGTVFEKDSTKVCDELRHIKDEHAQASRLQQLFLTVPTYDGTLGVYENWRTVVSELTSYDAEDVIYLAQMCALLVDAPKQGYKVKFWAKKDDRAKYSFHAPPNWFVEKLKKTRDYDEPTTVRISYQAERPLTTAMDHLHSTIQQEIEKLAKNPQSLLPEDVVVRKDLDLALPWHNAEETAKTLGDEDFYKDLSTIKEAVDKNFNNYMQDIRDVAAYLQQKADLQQRRSQQELSSSSSSLGKDHGPGKSVLGECISRFNSFLEIEEHHAKLFHSMIMDEMVSTTLKMDIMANDGRLVQTLKASCAYLRTIQHGKYGKYCYVVAYDALARIKSDACAKKTKLNGICNTVVPSIYPAMNMDRRWIRQYKEIWLLGK